MNPCTAAYPSSSITAAAPGPDTPQGWDNAGVRLIVSFQKLLGQGLGRLCGGVGAFPRERWSESSEYTRKYDPCATKADREVLIQAVRSLGSDAASIISKSTEIGFIEAQKGAPLNIYESLTSF